MLEVRNLSVRYGAIEALADASLSVGQNEIVCLIGANGAGKSTALNAISGVVPASAGQVVFFDERMSGRRASRIVRAGLVQVPEGRLVFPDMSVMENLEMGAYSQAGHFQETLDSVLALFPRLKERRTQLAGLILNSRRLKMSVFRSERPPSKPK